MFWNRKDQEPDNDLVPVPAELPPLEGLDDEEHRSGRAPRTWLWTLVAALAIVLLLVFVAVAAVKGIYDGLRDRAVADHQLAQEHYAAGLEHLESGDYELAIAELELAAGHDPNLPNLQDRLREAKELARVQVTPTSETRQDAVALLYRRSVEHFESGNLEQAVGVLGELRGLDAGYQRENVEMMLTAAHLQLGLNAVREDLLDEAADHFEAVLELDADSATERSAQEQLNLLNLYTAALNHWERDWPATIQALKGLYALAPEYKDVGVRLHDAHCFRAQDYADAEDWCSASDEYGAAAEVFPLEATVDLRDDAAINCESAAEALTPTPTSRAVVRPTASATAVPDPSPEPTVQAAAFGTGQIAFTSIDAVRRRNDIYIVDLSQRDARLLQENASQPAFAPGGKLLAFRNLDPVHLGLGVLNLRSNEVGELTAHFEDSTPAWSGDGKQIVFASDKHGGDHKWRIYVASLGEVRAEGGEQGFGRMPAWSPVDDQIAYHGCDERGNNCGVWLMQSGGFAPIRLTTDATDTAPSWSPDGSSVAFISARTGNWEIYVVDTVTGQETRLAEHCAADVAPAWSPDGKRLAFLSDREGTWALYVMEVRSGRVRKVMTTGDTYPDPVSERLSWTK
jgi:TolB protein